MTGADPEGYVPTAAECIREILNNYKAEALNAVLHAKVGALDGLRPVDLLERPEGRQRVYWWARGLSEGVMG
jgi:hypothetical protein